MPAAGSREGLLCGKSIFVPLSVRSCKSITHASVPSTPLHCLGMLINRYLRPPDSMCGCVMQPLSSSLIYLAHLADVPSSHPRVGPSQGDLQR